MVAGRTLSVMLASRRLRTIGLVVVVALLVLPACDSGAEPQAGPRTQVSRDPQQRILTVLTTGGFTSAGDRLNDFPTFVLFGDGRLFTSEYDRMRPPPVPPVELRRLTPEGVDAVVAAAREVRLDEPEDDFGFPGLTDAATTYFTLNADGRESLSGVYALGVTNRGPQVDEQVWQRRLEVQAFHQRLFTVEEWLPKGSVGEPEVFSSERYLLFTDFAGNLNEVLPGHAPPLEWPPDMPEGTPVAGPPGADATCAVVSPEQAQTFVDAASQNPVPSSTWVRGDQLVGAYLRPLLPDEPDCDSVVAARPA